MIIRLSTKHISLGGKFTYDFSLFTVNRKFKIGFFLFCTYPNLFFRFGFFHYYFSSSLLSASAASRLLVSVVLWLIIFSSGVSVVCSLASSSGFAPIGLSGISGS